MKTIKLVNLKLSNFKGIKKFELDAAGQDIKVFGDNATGKTTVFDAFTWLLFNRDSLNNSTEKMGIKTLDDAGSVIHRLDHEVEAVVLVDGKQLTLKKVYKEKWTKPRGKIDHVFGGHTTDYFVNNVPSPKKDFDAMVSDIVAEDVFRLLTDPSHFNKNLHWKDRRNLLLEIAGDVTDEEVAMTNKDLAKLLDKLNGNSIEDHKKIIASRRAEINKEIERIPIRIDEIHRNLPDTTGLNKDSINQEMNDILTEIDNQHNKISDIKNGIETTELKKKISNIDLEIVNVTNEHAQNEQQELNKLQLRLQEEQSNLLILQNDVKNQMQLKKSNEQRIKSIEVELADLRERYKEYQEDYKREDVVTFNHENNCVCPTCEQDLPQEKVDEAVANFNRNKADKLEKIKQRIEGLNKKGPELNKDIEKISETNEVIQSEIDKITEQGKQKKKEIETLETKVQAAKETVKPVEENKQYIKLNEEKQDLEQKIEALEQSVDVEIQTVNEKIKALQEKQKELQVDLAKFSQVEQSKVRIKELEEQQKKLAEEYEELEHQLYLTEEFTRTKVDMLTDKINSKFKYARFNLFEEQVNGGLNDVCETTYQGIPYSSGLNNAARINVGLDIINTLSEHYGVRAPIFVDNAESVTKLIDIDSQIISLIVNESDKELRVVTEITKESEVA